MIFVNFSFKTARVVKNIAMAAIWRQNMPGFLSWDIICSSKLKLFASRNRFCQHTNIRTNFRAKWKLLFIYYINWIIGKRMEFKSFHWCSHHVGSICAALS